MKTHFSSTVFAERLKSARAKADLTQKELSEQSGVSSLSISGYESSTKKPNLSSAFAIASALNVSIDWLCGLNQGEKTASSEPDSYSTKNYLVMTARLIDALTNESFKKTAKDVLISGSPIYDFINDYLKFKDFTKDWHTNPETINTTLNFLYQQYEHFTIEELLSKKDNSPTAEEP